MKVWMWQRLCSNSGCGEGVVVLCDTENDITLNVELPKGWRWLCPKPNLVLVDRKHVPHA